LKLSDVDEIELFTHAATSKDAEQLVSTRRTRSL